MSDERPHPRVSSERLNRIIDSGMATAAEWDAIAAELLLWRIRHERAETRK